MKITLNPDREVVETVKKGLEAKGGYCPCRYGKAEEFRGILPLPALLQIKGLKQFKMRTAGLDQPICTHSADLSRKRASVDA